MGLGPDELEPRARGSGNSTFSLRAELIDYEFFVGQDIFVALGGIGEDTFEIEVIDFDDSNAQEEGNWCTVPDLGQSRPGAFGGYLSGDKDSGLGSGLVLCGGRNNSGCSILTKAGTGLKWNKIIQQDENIGDYSAVVSLTTGLWITGIWAKSFQKKHLVARDLSCRWKIQ